MGLSPFLRKVAALPPAPSPQQAVRSAEGQHPAPGRVLHRCSGAGERAGSQFRSARAASKPVPATPGRFAAFSAMHRQRREKLPLVPVAVPDSSLRAGRNGHTRAGLMCWSGGGAMAEHQVSPAPSWVRTHGAWHSSRISARRSHSSTPSSHSGRKGRRPARTSWMFPKLRAGQCGMAPSRKRRAAESSCKGSCTTQERHTEVKHRPQHSPCF